MKLIGPFSEIRIPDNNISGDHIFKDIQFPIKEGGIIVDGMKIIDIADFSSLYSKHKDTIEIEEIEENQTLLLFNFELDYSDSNSDSNYALTQSK